MTSALRQGSVLAGLLLSAAALSGAAQAQDSGEGGARSTIVYSLGVNAGRNLDLDPGSKDSTAQLQGVLSYRYEMKGRSTQFSFDAAVRPKTDDEGEGGFYPSAGLDFVHDAPRTRFTASAAYTETEITDQSIGYDDTGSIIEYDGKGTRTLARGSVGVEGGIDMPLGYTLKYTRSRTGYRDMSALSSYAPTTNETISGGLRADVSAMTQLHLDLSRNHYQSENATRTERTTDRATIGVMQRIDSLTSVDLSVGRQRVETDRLNQDRETEQGTVYGLDLKRDDPLGSYTLGYDRSVTETGARDNLTFGRERETPRGTFSGMIGVSKGDEGSSDWIGALAFATELPRDRLTATLSRSVRSNDDGEDVVVTRVSGGVSHVLSPINSLDFGVTASSTEYPDRDNLRVDATVSYQHMLSQDTSLQAGVRLGLAQRSGREDARSESVFLNLTRWIERRH